VLIDRPDGWYAAPPALPDGGAGLVSTIDDLGAFAAMLAADGGGLLSEESIAQMLRDQTTERDRAENRWFFGENLGWGLTGILLTQRMLASPEPPAVERDFWSAAYAALA
jgi:CubicO group peptidase (beta-lactamase class C family)